MKRKKLMGWKRLATFAMAVSLTVADGASVVVSAAALPDTATTEMGSTETPTEPTEVPAETASTETPTESTETPTEATEAPTESTEAPTEATEAPTESTETPTEATEAPTETPTEATEVPTESTETPTEATEVPTETTELPTEETENPDENTTKLPKDAPEVIEGDQVLLGSEVGVSQVIGLEGRATADGTYTSDDGTVKKEYSYVNKEAYDETAYVYLAGKNENYLDAATGLYLYNGVYYSYGYDSSDTTCTLSGKVAAVMNEAPAEDAATGLYVGADGKYYTSYGFTGPCYYFNTWNEVLYLGKADANTDLEAVYGRKIADADAGVSYYEVGGKYYNYIRLVGETIVTSKTGEISFDRKHHTIAWNRVTNATEISQNGKLYHIGYQVKMNGSDMILDYKADDGQTFMKSSNSATTLDTFAPGEQITYEVRAVYYTQTKDLTTGKYSYVIAKAGDWSAAYAYAFSADNTKLTVPQVTGLTVAKKSAKTAELNWNAVTEASKYEIQILESDVALTDFSNTAWDNSYSSRTSVDADKTYYRYKLDAKYTYFRVRAVADNTKQQYVDQYGAYSDTAGIELSAEANLPVISGLKVETNTDGTFNLKWNPVDDDANIKIFYTKDASAFNTSAYLYGLADAKSENGDVLVGDDAVNEAYLIANKAVAEYDVNGSVNEISSNSLGLEVGKKYYFVAVTYDDTNRSVNRADITPYVTAKAAYGYYTDISVASARVSATLKMGKIAKPATKSGKTSITMTFDKGNNVTGYKIYRKNSKGKYKLIATTTSAQYVDSDLKEDTTYSYKARAYSYNTVTKKTVYSDYVMFSAETSTKNYIDVNAVKASKTSAKLTWNKVSGVTKYEIYRTSTSSSGTDFSKNNSQNDYKGNSASNLANAKWKLVKTITNAKTVKYTDKKLTSGESYGYKVIAYYKSGNDTKQIYDTASVALDVTTPKNVTTMLSGSNVKVTWEADKYASKYELRYTKYNAQGKAYTDEPVVKSTKKTSYTIKSLKAGEKVQVQVRAYSSKKWSGWSAVNQSMYMGIAKSVSAKNTTVKDANGVASPAVKVSWKKVSGAAYYGVYRSTSPADGYNKDSKYYYMPNDTTLIAKESNTDEAYNTVYYDDYKGQNGTIVGTSAVDNGQLQTGVRYYYYVVAYAENGTAVSIGVSKPASVVFNATASIKKVTASKGKTTVSINKVAGATEYVVYRSTKKGSGYKEIGTTKKTTYTDKKTTKGKTYYYKVVAVGTNALKADFETDMSKAVKVKAK